MIRDLPQLWRQSSEYDALRQIIQSILLVAIAAELALLLLSHRTSAAIEVVIFVVGAKDGNAGHLWVGAAAWHCRSRRSHRGALLLLDQERSLRIRWPVVGINFVIP